MRKMATDMIQNCQSSRTNCVEHIVQEVGAELIVSIYLRPAFLMACNEWLSLLDVLICEKNILCDREKGAKVATGSVRKAKYCAAAPFFTAFSCGPPLLWQLVVPNRVLNWQSGGSPGCRYQHCSVSELSPAII